MRRTMVLSAAASFSSGVLGVLLTLGILAPSLGQAQAVKVQSPAFVLIGPDGADAGALESSTNPRGEPISSLRLTQNGALRVRMETGRNGPDAAALTLRDRSEQTRIRLALATSEEAGAVGDVDAIDIFDRDQHVRVHIGVDGSGAPSLQLLDAEGNVTWSAQ